MSCPSGACWMVGAVQAHFGWFGGWSGGHLLAGQAVTGTKGTCRPQHEALGLRTLLSNLSSSHTPTCLAHTYLFLLLSPGPEGH